MSTTKKRTSITLEPEWEPVLTKLKKERFYDQPKAEVIRYLIAKGIEAVSKQNTA